MFVADVSRLTPSSISIPVLSTLARWSVQPLHTKVLLTLTMLLFIPLHFLCTHFWQLVHCTEFLSTPLPQTLHGHLPVLCSPMWLFPQIITLVLFIFTFTPLPFTPSFPLWLSKAMTQPGRITRWPHPFLIHCQRLPRERKLLSLCWLFDSSTWYNVNIAQQLPNTSHAVSQCKITLNQWVLNKIKSPKSLSISSNTTL